MADLEEVDVERHPSGGDCSLSTPVLTRQAVDGRNPGSGDEGPDGRPKFATGPLHVLMVEALIKLLFLKIL